MSGNPIRLSIILDNLRSAHNVGNVFRIAEAVACAEIICCGYTPAPPHPKLAKTAMGTDEMVPCRVMPDAVTAIRTLREEGYKMILGAEYAPGSVFAWEKQYEFPLALVLGNEALGISPEALAEVDGLVSLPMFGEKCSINVGNAAAAILYAIIGVTHYGVEV
jgi:tRNA G18 (ribose-2'-O)-methylase SpoU